MAVCAPPVPVVIGPHRSGPSPAIITLVAVYFTGPIAFKVLGTVARSWRAAVLADSVWRQLVARDFPASPLQPWPGASWRCVYMAEYLQVGSPSLVPASEDRPLVNSSATFHVMWGSSPFRLVLDGHRYARLAHMMDMWKTRRLKKNGWKAVEVVVSETGVVIHTPDGIRLKARLPLQYIGTIEALDSGEIHITPIEGSPYPRRITLRASSPALARLWVAVAIENTAVFTTKHNLILHSTPSSDEVQIATRFQDILSLRKLHAFRLAQDVFKALPANATRKSSISQDALHAFTEKHALSFLSQKSAAPAKKLPSFRLLRLKKPARTGIQQHCTLCRSLPYLLRRGSTTKGHTCAHFIRTARAKATSAASPQHCHAYLCDVRDVIAHVMRYVLAYRKSELGVFELSQESLETAVLAAIERKLCADLAKPIKEWARGFTSPMNEASLAAKLTKWSKLPPSSPQFGLGPEFCLPWMSVLDQLVLMETEMLPSGKLRLLLGAAKDVYTTFAKASVGARTLAADDFLPVFIFCICNAKLKKPLTTLELMWSLCNQESLQGEAGYYLTMLEASLEYLRASD
ncbi:hypothetical protein SPRG_07316 [Saprolegnia parasitica CBS 223.65]|uniref:VPS9 domain-containing protein n=1 Tax=Saprolegnia parasitica (strain CBS 223.65) TaxID=695850 RepID=A0A067CLN5_SAPPC|nr:hypothetical protein SPRG_07316 [Saprolegnia parasitica CBS 223.65]KDO27687.1 hypothetical protein SPRG_07316 [Saprolegnia parasitica CBS 223.65]|eukprot:XP_012201496.1 hypothetical protein SPRG_07316 [Saprolegnia parasitica CBS 223.65]